MLKDLLERSADVGAPPPVRGRQARSQGRDQPGDGRDLRRRQAAVGAPRDFAPAQRDHRSSCTTPTSSTKGALLRFARAHQYEETAAALSAMSGVRIATVDQSA